MNKKHFALLYFFMAFIWSGAGQIIPELVVQNGHSTAIKILQLSLNSKYLLSIDNLNSVIVWDLQSFKQYGSISGIETAPLACIFNDEKKEISILCENGDLISYNLKDLSFIKKDQIIEHKITAVTNYKNDLYFSCGGELYKYSFADKSTKLLRKDISSISAIEVHDKVIILGLQSTQLTLILSKDSLTPIKEITAQTTKLFSHANVIGGMTEEKSVYTLFGPNYGKNLLFAKGLFLTSEDYGSKIINAALVDSALIYSTKKGALIKVNFNGFTQWEKTYGKNYVTQIESDQQNSNIYLGCNNGDILIVNNRSGELIKELKGQTNAYYKLKLSSDNESLLGANYNNELSVMSLSPFNNSYMINLEDYVPVSNEKLYYIVDDIKSFDESKVEFTLIGVKSAFQSSSPEKTLIIYNCTWNYLNKSFALELLEKKTSFDVPAFNYGSFANVKHKQVNKKYGITLHQDESGLIEVRNQKTNSLLLKFYKKSNDEFIYIKENYYFGAKTSLKSLGYRFNGNIYGVETFDVYYNRPDVIFKDCGFIDPEIYSNISKAVSKRAIFAIPDFIDGDVPEVKLIVNGEEANPFERTVRIEFNSKGSPLDNINIFVNGSPVKKLDKFENENAGSLETKLALETGKNVINCVAINKKGISSFNVSSEVIVLKRTPAPSETYLVCLGSSKFMEKNFDLNFPAKDAKDIQDKFIAIHKKAKVLFFKDENVSANCVDSISSFLKNSKPSDKIILFFAGHGILNKDMEYYLSTYAIDFNEPEKKGINFKSLEKMLSEAPARNKIMLIDACHSGELEKDDIVSVNTNASDPSNGDLKFRGTNGVVLNKKYSPGLLEFSKNMFINFNSTTGVNIVSSSSGVELSMESKDWNNGLFTYCLINALDLSKSDVNNDSRVDLNEFCNYVKFNVNKISRGKQNPSLRSDNFYKSIYVR